METHEPRDRGYTLLELLAAIAIMGIAFAAIFAGLGMFLRTETVQRDQAQLDASLRTYAEAVIATPYTNCATGYSSVTKPNDGHNKVYTVVMTVKYWDGLLPAGFGTTCTTDKGLQQITVQLTGSDGEKGTLTFGKSR